MRRGIRTGLFPITARMSDAVVIVFVGVAVTFVAWQPDHHPAPHAGLGGSTGRGAHATISTLGMPENRHATAWKRSSWLQQLAVGARTVL